ncbi:MAG: folate-binding protein [Hyphomicrobium sp.]|nr:MAG: folate-binding protein [Hyphomicrobium sp.]PPD01433.1 MAG: folate-binding protein [Hyphomicrobium sp.]
MTGGKLARLPDRGTVSISGPDSAKLLQGLITQDMDDLKKNPALFAALLSPQGKILFEFFILPTPTGFILDVARERAPDLVKRLTMYKLRADVEISDQSQHCKTFAYWGHDSVPRSMIQGAVSFADPRRPALGFRILADASQDIETSTITTVPASDYDALRVALIVPQGGYDYAFADITPHEANFDLLNGVSFTKGCYVGQEVVARMHNKTVIRKRIVQVIATSSLTSGSDILLGEAVIGKIGTVDGNTALALLRLDRALEAAEKGLQITAGDSPLTIEQNALESYRAAAVARSAHSDLPR